METGKSAQPDEFEHQPRGELVSIAPSISARDIARQMIATDAPSCGGSQPAQRALARRLGISRYTLRNLASGGLKRVCVDLYARLKAEQIRRLSASLVRASHELEMARAIGLDPRSPEFRALEAAAQAARKVMEES
jgi:ribosomal protein S14